MKSISVAVVLICHLLHSTGIQTGFNIIQLSTTINKTKEYDAVNSNKSLYHCKSNITTSRCCRYITNNATTSCDSSINNTTTCCRKRVGNATMLKTKQKSLTKAYLTFYIMTMILTVSGYVLVLPYVVSKGKVTSVFICSLAIADLFVALVIVPIKLSELFGSAVTTNTKLCRISNCITLFGLSMSALNMLICSIDRFVFFASPFEYADIMTFKRACILCIATIFLSIPVFAPVIGIGSVGGNKKFPFCSFKFTLSEEYLLAAGILSFLIPLMLVICIQISIIVLTRKYFNQHRKLVQENLKTDTQRKQVDLSMKREKHIQRTFLYIIICFFACWGPFVASIAIVLHKPNLITPNFILAVRILVFGNSFINPLIMFLTNQHLLNRVCCRERRILSKVKTSASRSTNFTDTKL